MGPRSALSLALFLSFVWLSKGARLARAADPRAGAPVSRAASAPGSAGDSAAVATNAPPRSTPAPAGSFGGQSPRDEAVGRLLQQARDRFDGGILRGEAALLERSLDAMRLANALEPRPGLELNMAQVERKLGRCRAARARYERYLRERPEGRGAQVARYQLEALGACELGGPGAGEERWPPDEELLPEPLRAASGAREVASTAALSPPVGFDELAPSDIAPEGTAAAARPLDGASTLRAVAPWALAGASLVTAASAGMLWLEARASHDQALGRWSDGEYGSARAYADAGSRTQNAARIVGVLSLGFGVGALLTAWVPRWGGRAAEVGEAEPQAAQVSVGVAAQGISAAVAGSF